MSGLDWSRWPNFSEVEMRCRCGCGRCDMDVIFMDRLQALREAFGTPLPVTSGFRCPYHNAEVSTTGANGPHTTGRAADIRIARGGAFRLLGLVTKQGGFSGIGLKQHGDSRFIHLDDLSAAPGRPRPTIWSY